MRFSKNGPIDEAKALVYIQEFFIKPLEESLGLWLIVTKESQEIVGFAGLIKQKVDKKILLELGYRLSPSFWGRGFAKEACETICFYAKQELRISELISIIDYKNEASLSLSKRLGFKFWKNFSSLEPNIGIYKKSLT